MAVVPVDQQLRAVLALEDPRTALGRYYAELTPFEREILDIQRDMSRKARIALGRTLLRRLGGPPAGSAHLSGGLGGISDWFKGIFENIKEWTTRVQFKFGVDPVALFTGGLGALAPNLQPLAMVGALAANPGAAGGFAGIAKTLLIKNPDLLKSFLGTLGGLVKNVPGLSGVWDTISAGMPGDVLRDVQSLIEKASATIKSIGLDNFLGAAGKAAGQAATAANVISGSGADPNKVIGPGGKESSGGISSALGGADRDISKPIQDAGVFDVAGQAFSVGAGKHFADSAMRGMDARREFPWVPVVVGAGGLLVVGIGVYLAVR